MLEKISFDPKQLIQQSKGNNAFLKRLVKEEIDSQEYPIYLLIENTEDELRLLEEERNWILFWMGIVVILNPYLNLVHQEIVLPTMVLGNIGLILSALLLGFYFKKNAFIGAYRLILDVLDRYQQNQLKAIRLSSMYLDIKHFFQDFEKKLIYMVRIVSVMFITEHRMGKIIILDILYVKVQFGMKKERKCWIRSTKLA